MAHDFTFIWCFNEIPETQVNGRAIVGKLFYQMQVEVKRDWSYLSSKYDAQRVHTFNIVDGRS